MNCKNCEYAIKCRSLQDNEWYTRCTYEEGECVKIADLEDKLANADYQLEGRDNEIRELKAQIEKMKCCEMCKHKNFNWGFSPICEARDKIKIENPLTCKCDKWEIKENDR